MRFPAKPPTDRSILPRMLQDGAKWDQFTRISRAVDAQGRYLHWDELRRKEAPDGFSVEEWWAATKLARVAGRQHVSLLDIAGRPFSLA